MEKIMRACRIIAYPLILCFFVAQLPRQGLAQENITITTYYPSPAGSYLNLNVQGSLVIGQGLPAAGVSPRIEFTHDNTNVNFSHWNIDQANSNSNNPRLRFFTEPNDNTNGLERLVLDNDGFVFNNSAGNQRLALDENDLLFVTGGNIFNPGGFVLRANASNATDPGDIVFQNSGGLERARLMVRSGINNDLLLSFGASGSPAYTFGASGDLYATSYEVSAPAGALSIADLFWQIWDNPGGGIPAIPGFGPFATSHIFNTGIWSAITVIVAIILGGILIEALSSIRFKKNVKTIDGSLDKVLKLRGVEFDWKESGRHDIGLVAEEAGKVFPDLLTYDKDGTTIQGFRYNGLIAVLIEAIKDQNKLITKQADELNSLRSRVDKLEKSLSVAR